MKNFVGLQSFRKDIKPYFRFFSAPVGDVVEAEVHFRAYARSTKGYYLTLTVKELGADGSLTWMPFSAPSVSVLLSEAARFNLGTLQKFALMFDAKIPELAASWRADGDAVIKDAIAVHAFESPSLSLAL